MENKDALKLNELLWDIKTFIKEVDSRRTPEGLLPKLDFNSENILREISFIGKQAKEILYKRVAR